MSRGMKYAGILLVVLGAVLLVKRMGLVELSAGMVLWGAIATVGGVKIYRGFTRPGAGGVFWGTMFLGVGLARVLGKAGVVSIEWDLALPLLVLLAGAGTLLTFVASPRQWHVALLAVALLGLGSALTLSEYGIVPAHDVLNSLPVWGPVTLIAFGAALLLNRRAPS